MERSSRPDVFWKKGVLSLAWSFIKKETLAEVFCCEFCEISNNTFSYSTPLVALSERILYFSCIIVCSLTSWQSIVSLKLGLIEESASLRLDFILSF